MNPFGLSEGMVCVFGIPGSYFWLQTQCPECPLKSFLSDLRPKHTLALWLGREWEKKADILLSRLVVWFSEHMDELFSWCSKLKKTWGLVTVWCHQAPERDWAAVYCLQTSIWLIAGLSSGPGSWDLPCKGLGLLRVLPGALLVVTRAPGSPTFFPGGAGRTLRDDTGAESPRGSTFEM